MTTIQQVHNPGPKRVAMLALQAQGFRVTEAWCGHYYDGMHAIKRVGQVAVEVYVGNADDGEYTDLHYAPVVYVHDVAVARGIESVEKAARIADFRIAMCRAALVKIQGEQQ